MNINSVGLKHGIYVYFLCYCGTSNVIFIFSFFFFFFFCFRSFRLKEQNNNLFAFPSMCPFRKASNKTDWVKVPIHFTVTSIQTF